MSQQKEQATEWTRAPESAPQFLIHNEGDHVAVAVQDVEPKESKAVYMDSDRTITIQPTEAIPLGHKVALVDLGEGVEVIEYGVRVGVTRQPIKAGQLVHVHNVRSARWQNSI
ncbi:MAG TPA: UxaA family hydrolase [Ktedonobacteraceae bacterium]|nr:UxaA family hydrolase [Ktedonobacteraceae bacterium]